MSKRFCLFSLLAMISLPARLASVLMRRLVKKGRIVRFLVKIDEK